MSLPYNGELIPRAKQLRRDATKQENHLWHDFLRTYPVRFQRQKTIAGFITDFYCHQAKLVIEVDGVQHFSQERQAYDAERSAVLSRYGVQVIRFSNNEIDNSFPLVCESIHKTVQESLKASLSEGGGTAQP